MLAAVCSVVSILIAFWYSAALGSIALAAGALFALRTWLSMRSILTLQREWQIADELLSGLVLQAVSAVSKLRVAGADHARLLSLAVAIQPKTESQP